LKLTREQIFDFAILTLRWYLAVYMASYGWSKMTGGQFGLHDPALLDKALRDVDKFDLAWYLFSLDKSFSILAGLLQIIGAVLIVINRTALIGALILLPVLGQIFLVDLAFTTSVFGPALTLRLGIMIISDILILFYYKDRMIIVWHHLTDGLTTKFNYKWWVFILMPLIGLSIDFLMGLLSFPIRLLITWLTK
jgi:uncharacterized membrane protein YphA (DoxX/SURF4 family)